MVNGAIVDDVFLHVSSVVKRSCMSHECYVAPKCKPERAFQQRSPMGASRIIANATNVAEHISKSMNVHSLPRYSPRDHTSPDLVASVDVVSSFADSPACLIAKRRVVQGILDWAVNMLSPHQAKLESMMPSHVLALPARHNVAFIAVLCRTNSYSF